MFMFVLIHALLLIVTFFLPLVTTVTSLSVLDHLLNCGHNLDVLYDLEVFQVVSSAVRVRVSCV